MNLFKQSFFILITFLGILQEIITQEVKKNFRNYYRSISSTHLLRFRQTVRTNKVTDATVWFSVEQNYQSTNKYFNWSSPHSQWYHFIPFDLWKWTQSEELYQRQSSEWDLHDPWGKWRAEKSYQTRVRT